MTATAAPPSAAAALARLAGALDDLAVALASGRADDVLSIEPRLTDAMGAVRASTPGADRGSLHAQAAAVRDGVARCRRLGGTVPALLSVMFPGAAAYGANGRRREPRFVPSTRGQVI